ncbi:hypothetical protein PRZ48_014089 [Zasmidium cellare]|uniref:F-box domain-containing protein n=1 Tax=Zasmidium cellare TaxID=395010 RepID=A0ABR0DZY4_ZASCE|nr:hypothetical protein PRZ48_014089 [Zasmidium cellare]
MASEAAHKVFNTAELLEAILLQVGDFKTLLFSQRTCKLFQNAITGSVKLQQALFRHDDPTTPEQQFVFRTTYDKGIKTPECYNFSISREFWSGEQHMSIWFHSALPTGLVAPSGSWRKMYAPRRDDKTLQLEAVVYKENTWGIYMRAFLNNVSFLENIPASLHNAPIGALMDWMLEEIAERNSSKDGATTSTPSSN